MLISQSQKISHTIMLSSNKISTMRNVILGKQEVFIFSRIENQETEIYHNLGISGKKHIKALEIAEISRK